MIDAEVVLIHLLIFRSGLTGEPIWILRKEPLAPNCEPITQGRSGYPPLIA